MIHIENQHDDLVVILASYTGCIDKFSRSNPDFRAHITHHVNFPDYTDTELFEIAEKMLVEGNCCFSEPAKTAFR